MISSSAKKTSKISVLDVLRVTERKISELAEQSIEFERRSVFPAYQGMCALLQGREIKGAQP